MEIQTVPFPRGIVCMPHPLQWILNVPCTELFLSTQKPFLMLCDAIYPPCFFSHKYSQDRVTQVRLRAVALWSLLIWPLLIWKLLRTRHAGTRPWKNQLQIHFPLIPYVHFTYTPTDLPSEVTRGQRMDRGSLTASPAIASDRQLPVS